MIVVCPKCSTKNRFPEPLDTSKIYRCAKCKTVVSALPSAPNKGNLNMDLDERQKQWLESFLTLYRQSTPLLHTVAQLDANGQPADPRSFVEALQHFPRILQSLEKLPTPQQKELQNIKDDFENTLIQCIEACGMMTKMIDDLAAGSKLEARMHFATVVSYISSAAIYRTSLLQRLNKVGQSNIDVIMKPVSGDAHPDKSDYSNSSMKEKDYLREALGEYLKTSEELAENRFQLAMWHSWSIGGYALLIHKKVSETLSAMPDSPAKAKSLLELGTQTMVSSWFWKWYRKKSHTEEEKGHAVWTGLTNIQNFLDIKTIDNVELYCGFNREFQAIIATESKRLPIFYIDMFHQRYQECIRGEQIVKWKELSFPLDSHRSFIDKCSKPGLHIVELEVYLSIWYAIIIDASNVMYQEFNRLFKSS